MSLRMTIIIIQMGHSKKNRLLINISINWNQSNPIIFFHTLIFSQLNYYGECIKSLYWSFKCVVKEWKKKIQNPNSNQIFLCELLKYYCPISKNLISISTFWTMTNYLIDENHTHTKKTTFFKSFEWQRIDFFFYSFFHSIQPTTIQ